MSLDTDGLDLYIADLEKHKHVQNKKEAGLKWGIPLCCQGCEGDCNKPAKWRRQNTRYAEERSNWVFECDDCFERTEEMWKERWAEYWSMVM